MKLVQNISRNFHILKSRLSKVSEVAPITFVDIGASYFLHKPWIPLILSGNFPLVSVDPNADNLGYLDAYSLKKLRRVPRALASASEIRTLYRTNVDSGSSLYPPEPSQEDLFRNSALWSYLFPVRELSIETTTLDECIEVQDRYLAIKIDVQGAEGEILDGAENLLKDSKVISIELETTLKSRPVMTGSSRFYELQGMLERFGFELIWIRPTLPVRRSFRNQLKQEEADALFMLTKDRAVKLGESAISALRAMYGVYGLNEEIRVLRELSTISEQVET